MCPSAVVAEANVANLESSAAQYCVLFLLTWPCFCDLTRVACDHQLLSQSASTSIEQAESAILYMLLCAAVLVLTAT